MPSQVDMMDVVEVIRNPSVAPALLKRAVVSVMQTLKSGSPRDRFENAYKIAVWRLTKGVKGGTKGRSNWRIHPKTLKLTRIGSQKQRAKATDRVANAKIKQFDRLVADLQKQVKREEEGAEA